MSAATGIPVTVVFRALAASLLAAAVTACTPPQPRPHNVLLITFDTLRRDHLGGYGYTFDTSPHMDELASHATRYERAYSTAPWTLPTHASLFTGKHPFEHGARTVEPLPAGADEKAMNAAPLGPENVTLAEVLSAEGYRTAGFVANPLFLGRRFQLDQGFETYEVGRAPAGEINRRALEWLDRHTREHPDAPFFLFLNYMDTHRPYRSRPASERLPQPSDERPGQLLNELAAAVMESPSPASGELAQRILVHYDAAIANVDEALGELLRRLRERGLYDDTLIVVTSDHGEYFGEHDLVEHSKDIYEPAIRVPLIIKAPGQTVGRADARVVTSVDLPRILLDLLPALRDAHRDTFPYEPENHPAIVQNYYSRAKDLRKSYGHRFDRVRTGVLLDRYKFIRSSDGSHELYDLATDPAEEQNLVDSRPELAARAQRLLSEFMQGREVEARADGAGVSGEEVELLKELGYL